MAFLTGGWFSPQESFRFPLHSMLGDGDGMLVTWVVPTFKLSSTAKVEVNPTKDSRYR